MQMRPHFGEKERIALSNYNFEDGFITEYIETEQFERRLASILGVTSTTAVNNGTIALSLAALAVGVSAGDEVIVPNFTMIATANAMRLIGAKPVFADIELATWCIDKNEIFKRITNRTKAVILVAANGRYPTYDVDNLRFELNERGIQLIEDAAQSLGSTYPDGAAVGTKGNVGTLSFSAPKIISTGQGGLVYSRDDKILNSVRKIKDFGREGGGVDIHPEFGINSKFTDLQALIGCAQLDVLMNRVNRRKEQNKLYERLLGKNNAINLVTHNYEFTCPWFMEILVEDRDNLAKYLKDQNVGTRPVYPEINKQPIYLQSEDLEVAKYISNHGLWLPSHMGVTDENIHAICNLIEEYFDE